MKVVNLFRTILKYSVYVIAVIEIVQFAVNKLESIKPGTPETNTSDAVTG